MYFVLPLNIMRIWNQTLFSIIFIVTSLVLCSNGKAQSTLNGGRANNWPFLFESFFNNEEWINFNNGSINSFQQSNNNIPFATNLTRNNAVSDKYGDLLFYYHPPHLYDSTHQIMQNGTFYPSNSGIQASVNNVIIPKPCSPSSYYLVEVIDTGVFSPPHNFSNHYALFYSEIDMSLNNGKGGVVPGMKSIFLDMTSNLTPFLTVTEHDNEDDYWLISAISNSNTYQAWHVTDNGIVSTPITSSLGLNWLAPINLYIWGDMKFSNSGEKLGVAKCYNNLLNNNHFYLSRFELLDFNDSTGQLSNAVTLDYDSSFLPMTLTSIGILPASANSVEFSPNDEVLYASTQFSLIQYDLTQNNMPWHILNKTFIIMPSVGPYQTSYDLELGPDDKIYHNNGSSGTYPPTSLIGVVNNPNVFGSGANYNFSQVTLNYDVNPILPSYADYFLIDRRITFNNSCVNTTVNFDIVDTVDIDSAHWFFDSTSTYLSSTTSPVQHTYSQPGNHPIKVRYYNGCLVDSTMDTIQIMPMAEADLGPDRSLCLNDTIQNGSIHSGFSYQWNTGDTTSYIYNPSADTYSITVSTPNCGTDFDTVIIDSIIDANITLLQDTFICNQDSLLIDASIGAGNYQWNTGDTTSSIWAKQYGSYILTYTNSCEIISDSIFIDTVSKPNIELGSDTTLCEGTTIFLDASDTLSNYLWHDGHTSPYDTVLFESVYSVTTSNICGSDSDNIFVNIDSVMTGLNIGNDTILCEGDSLLLHSPSGIQNYSWSNGATSPTITITNNDTVSIQVQNTCGIYYDTVSVLFESSPDIYLGPDSTYCYTNLQTLDASWSRANYLWQDGSNGPSHLADSSGKYWVNVTNLCGFDDDTIKLYYDLPIDISLRPDTILCEDDSIYLSVSHQNTDFIWNTGSNDSSITGYGGNSYYVIASNTCGTVTDTINLHEKQKPSLKIPQTDTVCEGELIEVEIAATGNFRWYDGKNDKVRKLLAPGKYAVETSNICGRISDTINILAETNPDPYLGIDTFICEGETVNLSVDGYSNKIYKWSNGDSSNSTKVDEAGIYSVTVISDRGCSGNDKIELMDCPINIFIPNAFTPNNDGLNDKFQIQGIDIKDFHILIFDRWGNLIFESNDINHSWNGYKKNNGKRVNQGTYNYKVRYRSGNYQLKERFGKTEVIY
jgi:gliding motility-associated-like protein